VGGRGGGETNGKSDTFDMNNDLIHFTTPEGDQKARNAGTERRDWRAERQKSRALCLKIIQYRFCLVAVICSIRASGG
jgi:hypothetical protein